MNLIYVYGASDDLVEIEGCKGADEFNTDKFRGDLIAPNGESMRIHVAYGGSGTWHIGAGQVDPDIAFPEWPMALSQHESGYSVQLTLEAPEGTRLTNIKDFQ